MNYIPVINTLKNLSVNLEFITTPTVTNIAGGIAFKQINCNHHNA